ncbi:hypothetical protein SAMN04489859_102422 [Paracoccus alcaliphilus]|uniref:Uncharacterized protein n=1 Tax=Paracoccus alcaliphilus TaxID=34002 RepID=A0A1H8KRW4_9RHOB|nr:hypothetical protein [Paracoccus alcaliphilus]WCR20448.1 hypothetical protein JHW40_21295 [Paracoccus alcaliphilus]SEN95637.1 hypothetical protein SAMN04489859_102422 [Paracoccus alcaliphilus]
MRLILIAGATVLTAGAAFAFARAVDQLARPPVMDAPAAAIQTERLLPQTTRRQAPQVPATTAHQPQTAAEVATPSPADQPAAAIRKQARNVAPLADRSHAVDENTMFFLPPGTSTAPDADEPVRHYDFVNLPLTGVYR